MGTICQTSSRDIFPWITWRAIGTRNYRKRGSVLDCSSPLELSGGRGSSRKRWRPSALQNAAALLGDLEEADDLGRKEVRCPTALGEVAECLSLEALFARHIPLDPSEYSSLLRVRTRIFWLACLTNNEWSEVETKF